jgi:integrase
MFIRFLVVEGKCRSDLDRAIPKMANWRLSSLPKYLPAADVEQVVQSCDLRTKTGRRDHAVLLLLARLALRAGDVRALQLGDIDWEQGTVRVSGKNGRTTQLPLSQEVGDALLVYIAHARPRAEYGAVFLRRIAPPKPLGASTVSSIARLAIVRSGVKAPSYGSHLLRHSAATEMLRQGASLNEIGSILRHSSIETTALYAKVDVNALRSVAQGWPQVQPC